MSRTQIEKLAQIQMRLTRRVIMLNMNGTMACMETAMSISGKGEKLDDVFRYLKSCQVGEVLNFITEEN